MEEWRPIRSFPGYSVSSHGNVRNDDSGRMMSLLPNQHGVIQVGLTKNKVQHKRSVSLLVANGFLSKARLETFTTPIHLDGDRRNNHVDNLTWRPRWFAVKYYRQFNQKDILGPDIPIMDIKTKECFDCSWDAATKYGLLCTEIKAAIVNRTYVWPTYQMFEAVW